MTVTGMVFAWVFGIPAIVALFLTLQYLWGQLVKLDYWLQEQCGKIVKFMFKSAKRIVWDAK